MCPEELMIHLKKRKDKVLANMKFIGNLFLRQLLAVKVIGQVVHDLIGIKDTHPEEHMIECVCALLEAIGYTLDATQHGKMLMSQFSARLIDLKRLQRPEGGDVYSKRIQFAIQGLFELRQNGWQKKLFKEQAKSKDDIRKDAMKDARQQQKGNDVHFVTQVVGARPAYIDELKALGPKANQPKKEGEPKIEWNEAYVKKIFGYFQEDKNGNEFIAEWSNAKPTGAEGAMGIGWLLDLGFSERHKDRASNQREQQLVSEAIVHLVLGKQCSWECLREALAPRLATLEDLLLDYPQVDSFFHALYAELLTKCGSNFNNTVLKPLPDSKKFTWGLLVNTMKRVKSNAGAEAARKALPHLMEALRGLKNMSDGDVKKLLQKENAL